MVSGCLILYLFLITIGSTSFSNKYVIRFYFCILNVYLPSFCLQAMAKNGTNGSGTLAVVHSYIAQKAGKFSDCICPVFSWCQCRILTFHKACKLSLINTILFEKGNFVGLFGIEVPNYFCSAKSLYTNIQLISNLVSMISNGMMPHMCTAHHTCHPSFCVVCWIYLAFIHVLVIFSVKEEEKKKLVKKSSELLAEKTQLELRAKQLSQNMNVSLCRRSNGALGMYSQLKNIITQSTLDILKGLVPSVIIFVVFKERMHIFN